MSKNIQLINNIVTELDSIAYDNPHPTDFIEFLPWAANQLQAYFGIVINKTIQSNYGSDYSKVIIKENRGNESNKEETTKATDSELNEEEVSDEVFSINLIYEGENLVQICFDKEPVIPRLALKIIGLAVSYQPSLTNITIKMGVDPYVVYEISKFLPASFITEICFDGSCDSTANFYLLLINESHLRYLSLSRCKVTDDMIKDIASTLYHPKPASKYLALLNLSSNNITDVGANYLADALRSNRRLNYLNLSDNNIKDEGFAFILDILKEFHLNNEEVLSKGRRHLNYLKEKNDVLDIVLRQFQNNELDRKLQTMKRKQTYTVKPNVNKKISPEIDSLTSLHNFKGKCGVDSSMFEKANAKAISIVGEFTDSFSASETFSRNGYPFCYGNNTLQYLNIAYNDLSFISLLKLTTVLEYQKLVNRRPKGLINLIIDGNNMPVSCKDLSNIEDLLLKSVMASNRRATTTSKRKFLTPKTNK